MQWIVTEELAATTLRAARDARAEVLGIVAIGWMNSYRDRIVKFAAELQLPAIYSNPFIVPIGGLISYSADLVAQSRESGGYVAKVLSGTKPADLPVQQPTKFELAIYLKTAKALGITIPQSIMLRADRVIQ